MKCLLRSQRDIVQIRRALEGIPRIAHTARKSHIQSIIAPFATVIDENSILMNFFIEIER